MQRVTSFILAVLIFGSAVVSAVFVVKAIRGEDDQPVTEEITEETNQEQEANMLKGTQLANFTPTTERISEVKTEDIKVGSGATIENSTQTVTAHYTGARVVDGIIFESSKDNGQTFSAPLNNLIQGWQTGMIGMQVGGIRRLTIPAALAYGDDASTGRPTGDLVFDIELFGVE